MIINDDEMVAYQKRYCAEICLHFSTVFNTVSTKVLINATCMYTIQM